MRACVRAALNVRECVRARLVYVWVCACVRVGVCGRGRVCVRAFGCGVCACVCAYEPVRTGCQRYSSTHGPQSANGTRVRDRTCCGSRRPRRSTLWRRSAGGRGGPGGLPCHAARRVCRASRLCAVCGASSWRVTTVDSCSGSDRQGRTDTWQPPPTDENVLFCSATAPTGRQPAAAVEGGRV